MPKAGAAQMGASTFVLREAIEKLRYGGGTVLPNLYARREALDREIQRVERLWGTCPSSGAGSTR